MTKTMKIKKTIINTISILSLNILICGCAANQSSESIGKKCSEDFDNLKKEYQAERYGRIMQDLEVFTDKCTGTGFVEEAQWMLAMSHYKKEDWIESRGDFSSFALNFPGSPNAEEAAFLKVVSSVNIEYRDSRDRENTKNAQKDINDYLVEHSDSKYLDSIKVYRQILNSRQIQLDFDAAKLYKKMDKVQSAAIYFKDIISQNADTKYFAPALLELISCYIELQQFDQAKYFIDRAKTDLKEDTDLGKAHELENELNDAIKSFQKDLKTDKKKKRMRIEDD